MLSRVGTFQLNIAPYDDSLAISVTAGALGPLTRSSFFQSFLRVFRPNLGVGVREEVILHEEVFSPPEDGIFLPDGTELTVTLLNAAGAAVPFVFGTASNSFGDFVNTGVAAGPSLTAGTFSYEGAH